MRKAQLAPHQPAIKRQERRNEADALVSRTLLEDADLKIAGAEDALADIENDVGFIEAQYPMRCMEGPAGEAAPALQREPAGDDEEDAADRRRCDLRRHIA